MHAPNQAKALAGEALDKLEPIARHLTSTVQEAEQLNVGDGFLGSAKAALVQVEMLLAACEAVNTDHCNNRPPKGMKPFNEVVGTAKKAEAFLASIVRSHMG